MPDILIRGMEMPTKCGICWCFTEEQGAEYCNGLDRNVDAKGLPEPDCPLHELPPHGDLISKDYCKAVLPYVAIDALERVPVIIPASEEGG
jgi:hypothetical protein